MGGRHPAAMGKRDERAHPVVKDALNQGYLDTMREYVVDGFGSHEAANEGRLSIKRAGEHLGMSAPAWVTDPGGTPCSPVARKGYKQCEDAEGPHSVVFRIHSKNAARGYIARESGGDPAKLKFNPFKRGERRLVDDSGNAVS